MKRLHIFKSGKHTAMNGQMIPFSEADLKASAEAYDPALHEAPIVVGHPKDNHPAFGWIKGCSFADGDYFADPDQVDAAFAELVAEGKYKKISASFYPPDHSANPVPGVYYLRHVGFLGGQPPAVKGLKAVEFSENEDDLITVEFSEWTDQAIVRMFRKLKNFLIEQFGKDTADKVIDEWEIEDITREALKPESPVAEPVFSEQTEKEQDMTEEELKAKQAELEKREAEFAEREEKLATQEKALAAQAETERESRLSEFCEGLVKEGKLLPAQKQPLLAALKALPVDTSVSFAEGDKTVEKSPVEALQGVFSLMPKIIDFSEVAKNGDEPEAKATAQDYRTEVDEERLAMHNKALNYAEKHGVSYEAALSAVN